MKNTLGEDYMAALRDTSRRRPAKKVERVDGTPVKRQKPPRPDITVQQAKDFKALIKWLDGKASEYAALGRRAILARKDADDRDDEFKDGVLETFARNVAGEIRRILKK